MRRSRFAEPRSPWRMVGSWSAVALIAAITGAAIGLAVQPATGIAFICGTVWGLGCALAIGDAVRATMEWLEERG